MDNDKNSPRVLIRTADEFEAAAIVTALSQRGIQATTVGGFTAGFIAEAPGDVSVIVAEGELEAAKLALKDIQQHEADIDWANVDVGEPEDE